MSGTGPVEQRIAVALEKIEHVIQAAPQQQKASEIENAQLQLVQGLRHRVRMLQNRLNQAFEQVNHYKEKLAQEQAENNDKLRAMAKNIDEVRRSQIQVEAVQKKLDAEIEAGNLSLDTANQTLKAQVDALHAERALEQIELAVVQRELQDILASEQAKAPEQSDAT